MSKRFLLLLSVLLLSCFSARSQDIKENLSKATLAVYEGDQVCKMRPAVGLFGLPTQDWGCKFESTFVCTATVVGADASGTYLALTAGHCFDWDRKDHYYVAETVGKAPVLHKANVEKFENDERYDFGFITFKSTHEYPVIPIATETPLPAIGDTIVNVNFSFGLVKQVAEGKVTSGLITSPTGDRNDELKGRYLVAIGLGPGASGSAIVAAGKIVGIVEAIFPGTTMPTVIMPTGNVLLDFTEDDSAGLAPKSEPAKHIAPATPKPKKHRFKLF